MLFNTFFEAQIGDPIWVWIFKGLNCLVWFYGLERLFDFAIRKWNDYQLKKEEATVQRPIGFR